MDFRDFHKRGALAALVTVPRRGDVQLYAVDPGRPPGPALFPASLRLSVRGQMEILQEVNQEILERIMGLPEGWGVEKGCFMV